MGSKKSKVKTFNFMTRDFLELLFSMLIISYYNTPSAELLNIAKKNNFKLVDLSNNDSFFRVGCYGLSGYYRNKPLIVIMYAGTRYFDLREWYINTNFWLTFIRNEYKPKTYVADLWTYYVDEWKRLWDTPITHFDGDPAKQWVYFTIFGVTINPLKIIAAWFSRAPRFFYTYKKCYESSKPKIHTFLKKNLKKYGKNKDTHIIIAGHSMGAAVAVYTYYDLVTTKHIPKHLTHNTDMFSIALPACCNIAFFRYLQYKKLDHMYNFIDPRDPTFILSFFQLWHIHPVTFFYPQTLWSSRFGLIMQFVKEWLVDRHINAILGWFGWFFSFFTQVHTLTSLKDEYFKKYI